MELPVGIDDLHRYFAGRKEIQYALPQLSKEQREFLLTGITADDWQKLWDPEEEPMAVTFHATTPDTDGSPDAGGAAAGRNNGARDRENDT